MNERLTAANLLCTYQYAVNLNVPNESDSARRDMWRYRSEKLTVNNETVWERNRASKTTYDPYVGLLMLEPNEELAEVRTEIYVLFLLCLALHPDAPGIFAVDSFDHSMHPRLARETTRLFCKTILEQDKTVFVTTHNEVLSDPWTNIIAHAPQYHGIKIRNRPHKAKRTYEELISVVCNNWNDVVAKCPQAKRFDEDVRRFLIK